MTHDADVLIIGAGGGGSVVAKELGEKGIKVLLLEAGPWYGHELWPNPNQESGAKSDGHISNLSSDILKKCFTDYEGDMNDLISGKFRWGPADRSRPPWHRSIPQGGLAWQCSTVGGTTLKYLANSPRAFPVTVDDVWPISYREMIPYYEKVEATLPVAQAPMTAKEEIFFYGAKKAGWSLIKSLNVTSPGYRPQPNAILPPAPNINDTEVPFDGNNHGCTLRGHCINGCHIGPNIEKTAKRSTLVSYIPLALKTGNVKVWPNTFVVEILTGKEKEGLRAEGVRFRNTWTGEMGELKAKVIVMSAGAIETPRLWLNSELPSNPWVGKGLTNHCVDSVSGIFDEKVLLNILGVRDVLPFVGQNSAARFDYPGLGSLINLGVSPGLYGALLYGASKSGFNFMNPPASTEPWDTRGKIVGQELKEFMLEYPRTASILILTDDEINQGNSVNLHSYLRDEHGLIPELNYQPSKKDEQKRDKLAAIAAEILKKAGAKKVSRADYPCGVFVHIQSTMRMGYVTDTNCEARQVQGLYIADNSVLFNSLGGANPTLTTQALATRTAEKMVEKYFS